MIEAIRGKSYRSDIAIDTIELFDSPCSGKHSLVFMMINSDHIFIVMLRKTNHTQILCVFFNLLHYDIGSALDTGNEFIFKE